MYTEIIDALLRREPLVYNEIFVDDVYDLEANLHWARPEWIFDLGANVGCFAWAAHRGWTTARVVALEPHEPSYRQLCEIARYCDLIQPLHAAVANGPVRWLDGQHSYSHQFTSRDTPGAQPAACQSITLPELVRRAAGQPYAVKCDIEGTEFELFEGQENERAFREANLWWIEIHIPTFEEFHAPVPLQCDEEFRAAHVARSNLAWDWLHHQTTTHEVRLAMPNPLIWMATGRKTVREWK